MPARCILRAKRFHIILDSHRLVSAGMLRCQRYQQHCCRHYNSKSRHDRCCKNGRIQSLQTVTCNVRLFFVFSFVCLHVERPALICIRVAGGTERLTDRQE
jgi:hypothetical protein